MPKGFIAIYLTNTKPLEIELSYFPYDRESFKIKHKGSIGFHRRRIGLNVSSIDSFEFAILTFLRYCYEGSDNEDYKKLLDIALSGDWELALEIAKGQGLL